MKDLLLIGGGGHCKAVIDVVERSGEWRIVGIVDSDPSLTDVLGYPRRGGDDDLARLRREVGIAHVTVGQIKTDKVRRALFSLLVDGGFELATIVSPLASVSRHARLAQGATVMHHALVGPDVEIGPNTIINNHAHIEHDARVGAHCHISTGARLNGGVIVGDGTFIGSGALVHQNITIGAGCVVGMGARIRASIPDGTVIKGDHP